MFDPILNYINTLILPSALHDAAESGDVSKIKELIGSGYNPNGFIQGMTPLHYAVMNDHFGAVRALVGSGAVIDNNLKSDNLLSYAVNNKNHCMVEYLLDNGANANVSEISGKDKYPVLGTAVKNRDVDTVNVLLKHNANPDESGDVRPNNCISKIIRWTPLHIAIYDGQNEIVKSLLDNGANPNQNVLIYGKVIYETISPLKLAAESGNAVATKLILNNPDTFTETYRLLPIISQVIEGDNIELIKVFLDQGISINSLDTEGKSLFSLGLQSQNLEKIEMLINEYGADVNLQDSSGQTPLGYAAKNKDIQTVFFLVDNGADVNIQDPSGQTPLFYAAKNNDIHTIFFLVDNGAELHHLDNEGKFFNEYLDLNNSRIEIDYLKYVMGIYSEKYSSDTIEKVIQFDPLGYGNNRSIEKLDIAIDEVLTTNADNVILVNEHDIQKCNLANTEKEFTLSCSMPHQAALDLASIGPMVDEI